MLSKLLLKLIVVGDTWLHLLHHMLQITNRAKNVIALYLLQVFCYQIWRERNARAHNKGSSGPNKLMECILVDVRAKLCSSSWFSKIVCSRPELNI